MVKPEWGTKRMCLNCGARFYDLSKKPITCPACETEFAAEDFGRTRRGRSAPAESAAKSKAAAPKKPKEEAKPEAVEDGEDLADVNADVAVDDSDEEEENVIEDASELGEDDDDVAEIVDGVEEEKET